MESLSDLQTTRTAHTLFLDFVSYSRLPGSSQAAVQRELQALAASTKVVQSARADDSLLVRRTGDGMALLFFEHVEQPLHCAMEFDYLIRHHATRLREAVGAPFRIRIGIHSGPVVVMGEGAEADVAGEGINLAQRVMDCGDDGHILLSGTVAELVGRRPEWSRWLHDLGTCRVKHDELVRLWSLHGLRDDGMPLGNEAVPRQVFVSQDQARRLAERDLELMKSEQADAIKAAALRGSAIALLGLIVVGGGFFLYARARTAAGEYTRFSRKIEGVVEKRRAEKARREAPPQDDRDGLPAGAPEPARSTIDTQVPDLTGLTFAEARARLTPLGLSLLEDTRAPHGSVAGRIQRQDPLPGRAMVGNGQIFVVLSKEAAPPRRTPTQPVYTGVLVDARTLPAPEGEVATVVSGDMSLPIAMARTDDEADALQKTGGNPLRLKAGAWTAGGVRVGDSDGAAIQGLPADAQQRAVLLLRQK